jgi:hypothetical protein
LLESWLPRQWNAENLPQIGGGKLMQGMPR